MLLYDMFKQLALIKNTLLTIVVILSTYLIWKDPMLAVWCMLVAIYLKD